MLRALLVALLSSCVQSSSVVCESGGTSWVCPDTDVCDFAHSGCVKTEQLTSCEGKPDATSCVLPDVPGVCLDGVCLPSRCGDGVVVSPEQCDVTEMRADFGSLPDCTDHDFYYPKQVACTPGCLYDTTACPGRCGDGVIDDGNDIGELCDGADPALACTDVGYAAGHLTCRQCGPGLDDCKFLDWRSHAVNDPIYDIHGATATSVFAVGDDGRVMHHDGATWTEVDAMCAGAGDVLQAVWAIAEGEAIAVGYRVAPSTSSFVIHVRLSPPSCVRIPITPYAAPFDVWAASASDIVVATRFGMYRYNGTGWTVHESATSFQSVWGSSTTNVYAVSFQDAWHSTGAGFSKITVPLPSKSVVFGASATEVYIGGTVGSNQYGLYRYDGSSWTALPGPPYQPVAGSVGTRVVIATQGEYPYAFDGGNWQSLAPPVGPGAVNSVHAEPSGRVLAGATAAPGGNVLVYPGGVQTTPPSLGEEGVAVRARRGTTDLVFATTANYISLNPYGMVWQFFDGNWIQDLPATGVPNAPFADIWIDGSGEVYGSVYGSFNADGLYKRAANGTWTKPLAMTTGASALWGNAGNDIWLAVGGSELQRWNGTSLVPCSTPCIAPHFIRSMWGTSSANIFAVGDTGTILRYTGTTWTAMTSGTITDLERVWGLSATDVYAVGGGELLHYDGASWTKIVIPEAAVLTDVWGSAPDDLFVVGLMGIRHWDGMRWTPVRPLTPSKITSVTGIGDAMFTVDSLGQTMRLVRTIDW